jgi:hypothetical protein
MSSSRLCTGRLRSASCSDSESFPPSVAPAFGAKSPPKPTSGDGERNGLPSLRRSASTSGEAGIAGARRWRGHRMGDECDEIARTRDEPRQETPYKTKTQIPRNRCDRPDSFFP